MNTPRAVKALLALMVLPILFAWAEPRRALRTASSGDLTADHALRLLRLVATTEAEVSDTEGNYVPLAALLKRKGLAELAAKFDTLDTTWGRVANYALSVNPSPDGKHYQASLVPQQGCGSAFFCSESAIIYEGKALGCTER